MTDDTRRPGDDQPESARPEDEHCSPAAEEEDLDAATLHMARDDRETDFNAHRTVVTGDDHGDSPSRRASVAGYRQAFSRDEVIAGRYDVVRFLASGGMGEVYEVEDRELGERVALKTILPEIAANPMALERFRREILLARKVTHPNVCRIFDIGRHVVEESGEGGEITFLTMELLSGETLSARLRKGKMSPDEALPLVSQMTAGLGAAHRAGIVHRDFKPANVFLVPEGDGERAVVTDFGLARTEVVGEAFADVTGTGEVLGTPAYMAPEQLEGQTPTPATDVYALGLVIYEMLTGAKAFHAETAFQMALKRLQGPPTAPSVHLPGIDPVWEGTILRCLEQEPSGRFADVEEISSTLSGETVLPGRSVPQILRGFLRSGRGRVVAIVVALVAAVLLGAFGLHMLAPRSESGSSTSAFEARRSVAVLGFKNVSENPEDAWISTALAEFLTTDLAAGASLRTVPGETVTRAKMELGMAQGETLGGETLGRLRANLDADLVVLGSYTVITSQDDAQIRLDIRVQDARSGDIATSVSEMGTRDGLFDLASLAVTQIRADLGVGGVGEADAGAALASLPSDPRAARLYSEGVARLRRFDPLGAKDLLVQAVAADPSSPVAYSELAKAWSELGYRNKALEAAEKANELKSNLGREDSLRVEGEYLMAARSWDDAVATFTSLWKVFPDNLEHGLRLVDAQVAAVRLDDALRTVEELRALPQPASDDPRIDLREARAAHTKKDTSRHLQAATRAAEAGRSRGLRLLEADARIEVADAFTLLSDYDAAEAAASEALAIAKATGVQPLTAQALFALATIAYHRGDVQIAEERFTWSLEVRREVGDVAGEGDALNALGGLALVRGDEEAARARFEQALTLAQEADNKVGMASALNNIAVMRQRQGDLVGAIDSFEQQLNLQRQLGDRKGEAVALANIGVSLYARGDLAEARRKFEQAVAVFREADMPSALASTLSTFGDVLIHLGSLDEAKKRHREALQIRRDAGEMDTAMDSELALAAITFEEAAAGRAAYAEVEATFEDLASRIVSEGRPESGVYVLTQLVELHLATGDAEGARVALDRAKALEAKVGDLSTIGLLRIAEALVVTVEGHADTGLRQLEDLGRQIEGMGILGLELELRYATARVLHIAGREAEASQSFEQLQHDARARGWILMAEKAARQASS